ncbi:MAG: hypothetical protein LUQ24_03015 [Methanobacterium sp.]|nr:hypothetical protein [Methanobacterium sp.]
MNFREFDLDDIMKDPDKRAKLYLYLAGAMILSTVAIVIGTLFFIMRVLKII